MSDTKLLSAVIAKSTGPEDPIKRIGFGEWFYIPALKASGILKNFSNNWWAYQLTFVRSSNIVKITGPNVQLS